MTTARIIAPPPVIYLTGFMLGSGLEWLLPLTNLAGFGLWRWGLAVGLLLAGAALARWAFVAMRQHNTSADPRKPSTALLTSGPFAHSRNPIYVAMILLYSGGSLLLNLTGPFCVLPLILLLMHFGVIRREESYLAALFGQPYQDYLIAVRRWL